jgi:hypothetical protein
MKAEMKKNKALEKKGKDVINNCIRKMGCGDSSKKTVK